MALKVDYVVRETATNLKRNLTLTFATIVTIAVTLAFAGAVRLIDQGVSRANLQFKGNVQFIVFMNPDATDAQVQAVGKSLGDSPQVKDTKYLDHDAAYTEFKEIFADRPEYTKNLTAADLPPNYKVFLNENSGNSQTVLSLVDQFRTQAGVREVTAAAERIKQHEEGFSVLRWILGVGALVIGVASLVLIINSIRIAMFARRREIEVMKLVGATNWFIRVPFMTEGLLQGLIGSGVGIGIMWGAKAWVLPALAKTGGLWTDFNLTASDISSTSILVAVVGAIVGVAGSFFAATRFLDV
jgi:cell division transport system permease protein